jgi:hypothetical protein
MNLMSLGHIVKEAKMVNVQNKKIVLALNGVVGIHPQSKQD